MKKTLSQKPRLSLLLTLVLLAAMVLSLTACSTAPSSAPGESPTPPPVSDAPTDAPTELGEGAVQFFLEVVTADGETTNFTVNTDEKTVGAALQSLEIIDGEQGEFGLFIKSVNGVTADFDTDGTYWAFYIDGEYANTGIDATEVSPGSVYSLKVEK